MTEDLDDLVFRLGALGYFGGRLKKIARDIQECDFVREKRQGIGQRYFAVWLKKSFHTIVAFILLIVILYFLVHISLQQGRGEFNAQYIFVEISDESTMAAVNALSGCYVADEFFNNRLVYNQVGSVFEDSGVFKYCSDSYEWGTGRGAWVLTTFEPQACSNSNQLVSESTDTFDILEAAVGDWYTNANTKKLVGSFGMKEFDSCKDYLRIVTDYSDPFCPVVKGLWSLPLYQVQTRELKPKEYKSVALTHPVYMSNEKTSANGREIIFFTGRSWVMTTESQLLEVMPIRGPTTFMDGQDLLTSLGEPFQPKQSSWVNFITDPLDPDEVELRVTPTRTVWYYPTHTQGPLPLVDRSREAGSLICAPLG